MMMSRYAQMIGLLLCCSSFAVMSEEKIGLQQAIELALAHDPRIDEKEAFDCQVDLKNEKDADITCPQDGGDGSGAWTMMYN